MESERSPWPKRHMFVLYYPEFVSPLRKLKNMPYRSAGIEPMTFIEC